jgi:uncharacterized membrane protein YhaH (DUF805 family)
MNWYLQVLKKYAVFSGRARRTEYWMFTLVNLIVAFVLGMLLAFTGIFGTVISYLYSLAVLIPSLAVGVRRLHDTGRTGWWLLIGFIPLIGEIVLIVFFVEDSRPGANQYGPNPKGIEA